MFECHVCGNKNARDEFVSEVFLIDGRRVLVEHIPANVCERCGEPEFSANVAETVRKMIHEGVSPIKTETLDVFALT